LFFVFPSHLFAASNAQVEATVKISVCGNNVKESGEQCDGNDLGGQNCQSLGYTGGFLSCNPDCTFDISNCTYCNDGVCNGNETCSNCPADCGQCSSGGGGGGGYVAPSSSATSVIFSGRAYPKSTVTLLKDAQVVATTIADSDAKFKINLTGLSGGNYIFGIYSEDNKGIRSSLLTFPISVTSGATTNVSGIFIAPTIDVDKSEVRRGDNIAIFGQSVPNSKVTIEVDSDKPIFSQTNSDNNGVYLYNLDTSPLAMEEHYTKSKAAKDGEISSFSNVVSFVVGTRNISKSAKSKCGKADLNCDGQVNLIDFSIAAYWYEKASIPENVDLNNDGKVNLVDFSIMAYYWTG